ncbi:MAG: FecCD family ABC transporter permease [Gammaproteobacteria bacterium]
MLSAARRLAPAQLLWLLAAALPVALLAALLAGPVGISPARLLEVASAPRADGNAQEALILSAIRLPRLLLAALVGVVLAVSGAAMQGLFRNPLADPSLIGVTSGASVGASCVIVFAAPWLGGATGLTLVAVGAAVGGLGAVVVVYRIATTRGGTAVATMLLAGIAIGALAGALNGLFGYLGDDDMLRRISLWQMGSLDGADWPRVSVAAAAAALMLVTLPRMSTALNALLLGESEARHLGIDVEALKRSLVGLVAVGVGAAVAVAGVIAFVGLVVPHIVRLLIGPDHRSLMPASALAGAILLVLADTLARVLLAPSELPTGVVTALIGAPVFFVLLARERLPVGD